MINVIIVEDNRNKLEKIQELIMSEIGISTQNVSIAKNVKEAKKIMRSTTFDLMILDLVLPLDEDDIESPDNGIAFLKTIQTNPTIHPPIHIVGLTGFTDLREQYAEEFNKYLWNLIDYKGDESDWREKLKEILFHLIKVRKEFLSSSDFKFDYDIAIICALRNPELDQILKLNANWEKLSVENDATQYYAGLFQKGEKKLKVICASSPQMGMVASATLAMKMINSFKPQYIIMTGIAAGYAGNSLGFGDILIADQSYDGTSGKIVSVEGEEKSFSPNPTPIPLDSDLKEKLRAYENHEVLTKIKRNFNGNIPTTELQIKVGPMVSVPFVIENENEFQSFKVNQRKLIGLEMEAYGIFYSATNATNPKPKPIVIKSVCDFGDQRKNDNYQTYAAYTSAQFLFEFAINDL